jgi:hypothetical protein
MPRTSAHSVLDLPKPAKVKRHKMVMVFDSARSAGEFKKSFKLAWFAHENAFPGTLVFQSHEIVEPDSDD